MTIAVNDQDNPNTFAEPKIHAHSRIPVAKRRKLNSHETSYFPASLVSPKEDPIFHALTCGNPENLDLSHVVVISDAEIGVPEKDVALTTSVLIDLDKISDTLQQLGSTKSDTRHSDFIEQIGRSSNDACVKELERVFAKEAFFNLHIIGQFNKGFVVCKVFHLVLT